MDEIRQSACSCNSIGSPSEWLNACSGLHRGARRHAVGENLRLFCYASAYRALILRFPARNHLGYLIYWRLMATGLGTSPPFSLPFLFLFLDLPIYLCPFPSFHVSVCPCKNFAAPTYFTLLRPVTTTLPTNRIANVIVRNCNPLMSRYYAFRVTMRCVATCVFHLYSHFRSVMFIFVFICRFAKDETIISSHI